MARSKWPGRFKRAWKRHRAKVKKRRVAAERAAAKAAKTPATKRGGIPVATTPDEGRGSRSDRWRVWWHAALADRLLDDDYDAMQEKLHRQRHRRFDRHHHYTCGAHTPPLRFASTADLNQHLLDDHPEPVTHKRGTESVRPRPRRMPAPTRPPNGPRTRARTGTGAGAGMPQTTEDAAALESKMHLIRIYMDKIRKEAVSNMGADSAASTLGDIGSMKVTTVSQIHEAMVALEAIGNALEEAVTGFQQNARTSEVAPIKEDVLGLLTPAVDGAQQVVTAVTAFLSGFDEEYGPDIRDAKAGERMDNDALTN